MRSDLDTVKFYPANGWMTASDRPHHHGNLRSALIAAGLDLLREGGPAALSLRAAAARAGVSHAAPAHHFGGLAGLLTAMATQAFRDFSATMTAARDAAGPAHFARLSGLCRGYLDFARDNGALFHLMFADDRVSDCDPDLAVAGDAAYDLLRDCCTPFGMGPALEIAVWSAVHGYATLGFDDGRADPVAATDFDIVLRLILGRAS